MGGRRRAAWPCRRSSPTSVKPVPVLCWPGAPPRYLVFPGTGRRIPRAAPDVMAGTFQRRPNSRQNSDRRARSARSQVTGSRRYASARSSASIRASATASTSLTVRGPRVSARDHPALTGVLLLQAQRVKRVELHRAQPWPPVSGTSGLDQVGGDGDQVRAEVLAGLGCRAGQ
jgi:hypothetical protein